MTGYNEHGVHYVYYLGRRYTVIRDGSSRLVWSNTNRSRLHFDRGSTR